MKLTHNPKNRLFEWVPEGTFKTANISSTDTPKGRIYTNHDTGDKFWSVTTMLSKTSDDTWLKAWEERIGIEAAQKESKRCCDRGDKIHLACELYTQNRPFSEQVEAAGEYIKLFYQLRQAIFTHVGLIYAAEIPVFSKLMKVGGRFDLLAMWRGELALIDYKGSNFVKSNDGIGDYQEQLCTYSLALEETYGIKVNKLVNIIANEKSNNPSILTTTRKEVMPRLAKRIKLFHELVGPVPN